MTTKVIVLVGLATIWVLARSGNPPAAHTGGFGEETCLECHDNFRLDSGRDLGGSFSIVDVPDSYVPGQSYTIGLAIDQPEQMRWGFQIAARFASTGEQAGTFTLIDPVNTQQQFLAGIAYVNHTSIGTHRGEPGPQAWIIQWTAPTGDNLDDVEFDAAGNAANNDSSPDGDYIYTDSQISAMPSGGNPD